MQDVVPGLAQRFGQHLAVNKQDVHGSEHSLKSHQGAMKLNAAVDLARISA